MKLTKLTPTEENRLRVKIGDLNRLKAKILNNRFNIAEFEIYKDIDNQAKELYIAIKHNPCFQAMTTGLFLDRL